MALSSSGTAIEHFQAELRQTNICSVTRYMLSARQQFQNILQISYVYLLASIVKYPQFFSRTLLLNVNLHLSRSSVAGV